MEIWRSSALELALAIRERRLSARDVCEATLERARRVGPSVGAFAYLDDDAAMQRASEIDTGACYRAPMAGVPMAIKDLTAAAGMPCHYGSRVMRGNRPHYDDGVVRLMREAGHVIVGKTSTAEFGLTAYTEPTDGPSARCPWDTRRTAGGSSGGAAAAVASGILPVAHGTDGGGSIRIPAAACGLVGMKPSRGLVSPGPVATAGVGLATHGVLTRTVADTAIMLDVLARPRPGDYWVTDAPAGGFLHACRHAPSALKIGVLLEPLNCEDAPIHPAWREVIDITAQTLRSLGHRVGPAPRGMTSADWAPFLVIWEALTAQIEPAGSEEQFSPLAQYLRARGRARAATDLLDALQAIQRLTRQLARAWADFDVIITPAVSGPPPFPHDLQLPDAAADIAAQNRWTPWASVWNITGAPSITVPVASASVDGRELPVGVLLSAVRRGTDAQLLQLAGQLEAASTWLARWPSLVRQEPWVG